MAGRLVGISYVFWKKHKRCRGSMGDIRWRTIRLFLPARLAKTPAKRAGR